MITRITVSKTIKLPSPLINTARRALFSSISQQLQSASYRNYDFKSSSLHFRSNGMSIVPYYQHPILHMNTYHTHYQIKDSNALTLNFLHEASEDFSKSAWESRKPISLKFKEAYSLLKVPHSEKELTFKRQSSNESSYSNIYVRILKVKDLADKKEVEISLRERLENEVTKIEDNLWEMVLNLSYDDYSLLTQSIKANLLYISGVKFAIEVTKEESIIDLKNITPMKDYKQSYSTNRQSSQDITKGKQSAKKKETPPSKTTGEFSGNRKGTNKY